MVLESFFGVGLGLITGLMIIASFRFLIYALTGWGDSGPEWFVQLSGPISLHIMIVTTFVSMRWSINGIREYIRRQQP